LAFEDFGEGVDVVGVELQGFAFFVGVGVEFLFGVSGGGVSGGGGKSGKKRRWIG
jgi:hypothetical protein